MNIITYGVCEELSRVCAIIRFNSGSVSLSTLLNLVRFRQSYEPKLEKLIRNCAKIASENDKTVTQNRKNRIAVQYNNINISSVLIPLIS
jgi:hypothetical protein